MGNHGTEEGVKSNLDKRQEIIQDIIKGARNGFGRLRETRCRYYYIILCIYIYNVYEYVCVYTHTVI